MGIIVVNPKSSFNREPFNSWFARVERELVAVQIDEQNRHQREHENGGRAALAARALTSSWGAPIVTKNVP